MCERKSTSAARRAFRSWVLWRTCLASCVPVANISPRYSAPRLEVDGSLRKIPRFHSLVLCLWTRGLACRAILERASSTILETRLRARRSETLLGALAKRWGLRHKTFCLTMIECARGIPTIGDALITHWGKR